MENVLIVSVLQGFLVSFFVGGEVNKNVGFFCRKSKLVCMFYRLYCYYCITILFLKDKIQKRS